MFREKIRPAETMTTTGQVNTGIFFKSVKKIKRTAKFEYLLA